MPSGAGASGFAAEARHQAAQIVSRPPYRQRPSRLADPLAGVLGAIGRASVWLFVHSIGWLGHHLFRPVFHFVFSGLGAGGWAVAALLAIALGTVVGVLLIRRRSRISAKEPIGQTLAAQDPDELERAAEAAEAAGENDLAVRLRFQLGLARLQAVGVIPDRLTMTSRQLRRVLRSQVFDDLASRHESIAYAKEQASPRDVTSARDGWGQLLAETSAEGKDRRTRQEVGSAP